MTNSARFDRGHTDDLMSFLAASPSPYHAVANAAERLEKAGFRQVAEVDEWDGGTGGKYVLRGGAIIAWYVPEGASASTSYRIVGAHTDSPNLRVKPIPDTGSRGWRQIAVEIYGGTLLNTWLDRDLGLSGRVTLSDGSHRLVHVDRALLRVPQLAVHLDRSVNADGLKLDKQRHMTPIWGLGEVAEGDLITFVAEESGIPADDIKGWDLMMHSIEAPAYLGRDRELVAGPRMDNLVSVHAGTAALTAAAAAGSELTSIPVLAAFDHEENGSQSDTGADGPLLGTVLERSVFARGGSYEDRARAFAAPSACRPTPGTPSTPTTVNGTSRATTRCPTAGRSSRSTSISAMPRTAADGPSSRRPASVPRCRGRASCPTTRCRAAPPSGRSPRPATASPPSTSALPSCPCTRRVSCAAPRTRICWRTP